MPTLIHVDGFAHQTKDLAQAGSGFLGIFDQLGANTGGVTFDTGTKRSAGHVASLKIVENGSTTTYARKNIAAALNLSVLVGSFYFRATAAPGTASGLLQTGNASGAAVVQMNTDGTVQINGGSTWSGSKADSNWHRLDFRMNTAANPALFDAQLDGVAGTQRSLSQTAALVGYMLMGSNTGAHNGTFWFQDLVLSGTTGDHPIGDHHVYPLYPTGMGTSTLGTTNPIVNEAGTQTALNTSVDDWNGGLPNTTDYITYTAASGDNASNFAEFTITDPTGETVIWDVQLTIAGFAASTTTDAADCRVYSAHGGTLLGSTGLIDYSGSTTVLGYHQKIIGQPAGGWTPTALTNAVVQWGYSNDTSPLPRLSAFMLEYAAPDNAAITTTTVAAVAAVPSPTEAATAAVTPTTVAGVGAVATPTVLPVTSVTPTTVAGVAAVATPGVVGTTGSVDASVTTTTVAGIASIPTPVVSASANVTPATVTAVASVAGAASVVATVTVTPGTVPVLAAIETPIVTADARAPPDTVEAVAAIPQPNIQTSGNVALELTTVEVSASIPIPVVTIEEDAEVVLDTVEAVVSIPTPLVTTGEEEEKVAGWLPETRLKPVEAEIRSMLPALTQHVEADVNDDEIVIPLL